MTDERTEQPTVQQPSMSYGARLLAHIFEKTPKDGYSKNGLPPGTDSIHTEDFVKGLQERAMKI